LTTINKFLLKDKFQNLNIPTKIKIKRLLQVLPMQTPYLCKPWKVKEETLKMNYREKWTREE